MKRALSIILASILLMSALPLAVSAADKDTAATGLIVPLFYEECQLSFDTDTGELTVTRYSSRNGPMDLPENFLSINPVFQDQLKKLVIGEGITTVGDNVFNQAKNLEEVELPSTLKSIGRCAFASCEKLTTINFPYSLEKIDARAFANCYSLSSVTLNEGLEKIGANAFDNSGLTRATVPATVTEIEHFAFSDVNAGFVMYGYKGSEAETYAKNNNITFRSLIQFVDVTVTEPVAGQKPSYTASAPDGEGYNAGVIVWTGEQGIVLSAFEPGKDYTVGINVSTQDGYAFDTSHPQLPGKLNGRDCMFTVSSEKNVYLYETFTCPSFCNLSGSFRSYLDESGIVTFELLKSGSVKYSTSAAGNTGEYLLENVSGGIYTLRVSKKNHVTREYFIVLNSDLTKDVKLCPLGDISGDGKVTTKDYAMANAHAQKVTLLKGYPLACGDVLKGDGNITTADAARINAAAQKIDPLW